MKHYIYILTAALALGFTSCADDYLDTAPNDRVSVDAAFATVENCASAVNGIAKLMTQQYLGTQGMNGEGTMKNWYNTFNGGVSQKCNQTGWSNSWNNKVYKMSHTSSYDYYPWFYYYKLIGNANQIIDRVDAATGSDKDKAYVKAQALVFRAYSYYNLATMYSKRWCDSNNGASDGLVLRISATDPEQVLDMPLSTLAETFQQIYSDLDQAITLFTESGRKPSSEQFYLPSLQAAYAVKARAALYREDWQTAADCAVKARNGHKLMGAATNADEFSRSDYAAGFNTPNDEWIWGVYEAEDQTLFYYSYFAYIGSNSSASVCRSYPTAISKQLIDKIPATDMRRNLFLVPTDEEFREPQIDEETGLPALNLKGDTIYLMNSAGRVSTGKLYKRGKNSGYVYGTSYIFAYMQFKLRAAFMPGGGSFNLFRSSEMYYIEAEADCHLGKDAEAAKLLYDIESRFDANYEVSTKTGEALLDEVRTYRLFDLFGEGYDWTDHKRWNIDINRKKLTVSKGLKSPGSYHSTFAITIPASEEARWMWVIPNKELDYNSSCDEHD